MMNGPEKDDPSVKTLIDPVKGRDIEVLTSRSASGAPGLGWKLSDETEKALDKIDEDLRAAGETVGRALIGGIRVI